MQSSPLDTTLRVTAALEELGVRYAIGGSLAAAVHGFSRATMDADVVAELGQEHIAAFIRAIGDDFYVDETAVREAVGSHGSFNLIHLETMFKVDIFVAKPRAFDRSELARRERHLIEEGGGRYVFVVSAEDVILAKLEWYRLGGGVSERQWRDLLGVITVQGDRLDRAYMREMAPVLEVAGLLDRALGEAAQADGSVSPMPDVV